MNCPKCGTDLNVTKVQLTHSVVEIAHEMSSGPILWETRGCPNCHLVLAVGKTEIDAFMRGKLTHDMAMKYADIIFEGVK